MVFGVPMFKDIRVIVEGMWVFHMRAIHILEPLGMPNLVDPQLQRFRIICAQTYLQPTFKNANENLLNMEGVCKTTNS